jgi:hypothetical protein
MDWPQWGHENLNSAIKLVIGGFCKAFSRNRQSTILVPDGARDGMNEQSQAMLWRR